MFKFLIPGLRGITWIFLNIVGDAMVLERDELFPGLTIPYFFVLKIFLSLKKFDAHGIFSWKMPIIEKYISDEIS